MKTDGSKVERAIRNGSSFAKTGVVFTRMRARDVFDRFGDILVAEAALALDATDGED